MCACVSVRIYVYTHTHTHRERGKRTHKYMVCYRCTNTHIYGLLITHPCGNDAIKKGENMSPMPNRHEAK